MRTALISLKQKIKRLLANCQGQTMLEYAMLAGFLAVAVAPLLVGTGQNIKSVYLNTNTVLDSASGSSSSPPASPGPTPSGNPNGGGNDGSGGGKKNKNK